MPADRYDTSPTEKLLPLSGLIELRERARREGRSVVHCHGCFDIVHPGHIRHLRHAKSLGDILLVTVTGDQQMSKGMGRPLIPEELRAENLAAIDCVDWVYVEHHPTALELLDQVRPDIYVKGKEYETNNDPRFRAERECVERHGGRVVFSSGDVVFSSTALINALEASVDPSQARLADLLAREDLTPNAVAGVISGFRGKRVLVIGETILDTYVLCDRPDVAGESPIMTLRPVERRHYDGGAAIIARHIAAMGGRPILMTPIPSDGSADAMVRRLAAEGIEVRPIACEKPLPEKQRYLVGAQKVMKVDLIEPLDLDAGARDRAADMATESGQGCDAAIIADFAQGLFSPRMLRRLCTGLRPRVETLAGDVSGRRASLRAMRDMDLLTPTENELREAYGMFDEGLPFLVWNLMEETATRSTVITMGHEGLIGFGRLQDGRDTGAGWRTRVRGEHVPALAAFAVDPLGCGDALLAATVLAMTTRASLTAASFLGSVAAAVTAQRIGNVPVSATDLRQGFTRLASAHLAFAASEVIDSRSIRTVLKAS